MIKSFKFLGAHVFDQITSDVISGGNQERKIQLESRTCYPGNRIILLSSGDPDSQVAYARSARDWKQKQRATHRGLQLVSSCMDQPVRSVERYVLWQFPVGSLQKTRRTSSTSLEDLRPHKIRQPYCLLEPRQDINATRKPS